MRAVDLYCLECEKALQVEHHIVFKWRQKVEFLQRYPRMMGMFIGDVLFMPAEDSPCLKDNHLLIVRQGEHVVKRRGL